MSIEDRRNRERQRRRDEILEAAWGVAASQGWGSFSMERVAAEAELGRATLYSYFRSIDDLVLAMAEQSLDDLGRRLETAERLADALDVPVRFAQQRRAAFALLFPQAEDSRPHLSNPQLQLVRAEAHELLLRLRRLVDANDGTLPEDATDAAAFVAGISLAGAMIPELSQSTTRRHRWQGFCLQATKSDKGPSQ